MFNFLLTARSYLLILIIAILIASRCFAEAQESKALSKDYVRLLSDQESQEPIALQTSIERLSAQDNKGKFTIDLVSAVHIAETSYYSDLNKRFTSYDSVLYELITDASFNPEQLNQSSDNPLSLSQKALQSVLGLSFQLEQVNYKAKNFVHADMSPQQFSDSMQKRGESISKLLLNVIVQSMATAQSRAPPDLSDFIMMGFSQHRTIGFRRSLARQFQDMESMLSAINGPEGSTIVSERNKVAIAVAKTELQKGKRKLAIFYGGAHMPDMKEQLNKLFNIESSKLEWLTAWNLQVEKAK